MMQAKRSVLFLLFAAVLASCTTQARIDEPPVDMGNFALGHNIVVVDGPQIGPYSRTATDDELREALTRAIDRRLGGYSGDKVFNLGMKIDAYALAQPGVPVVFTPKSVLVVTAIIWDDAAGKRLNEEDKVFTVFEGVSGKTVVSSGLTQTKEEQLENLANNAARDIQNWILEHPEWLGLDEPPQEGDADTGEAETAGN